MYQMRKLGNKPLHAQARKLIMYEKKSFNFCQKAVLYVSFFKQSIVCHLWISTLRLLLFLSCHFTCVYCWIQACLHNLIILRLIILLRLAVHIPDWIRECTRSTVLYYMYVDRCSKSLQILMRSWDYGNLTINSCSSSSRAALAVSSSSSRREKRAKSWMIDCCNQRNCEL